VKHDVSVKCVKRSLTGVRAFVQHHRMHHPRVNVPNAGVSGRHTLSILSNRFTLRVSAEEENPRK